MKRVRAIRGAIQLERNSRKEIIEKTKVLIRKIMEENNVKKEDIISVFFTVTEDLNKEFPAYALRDMGLKYIPALCAKEIDVPGSMKRVIRVLMHVNTNLNHREIKHQYLGETKILRPDLSGGENGNSDEK
ncbi:MAG: chorismate mutase [Candidatus Aminicenantia bacterium]